MVDIRNLPGELRLEAGPAERAALAQRIGIEALDSLTAEVELLRVGSAVEITGRIAADIVQHCAISNEPFASHLDEPVALRFVKGREVYRPEEEIEIDSAASDEIEFTGTQFDLGEEIAQSLALTIDPYATGPDAERVRQEAGLGDETSSGPFAALAALKAKGT
jgi:hypothetical protein